VNRSRSSTKRTILLPHSRLRARQCVLDNAEVCCCHAPPKVLIFLPDIPEKGAAMTRAASAMFQEIRTSRRLSFIMALLTIVATACLPSKARAQACPVNIPRLTGEWLTLPYQMPINPISATLLHTGQVLIVAGSENDASNNSKGSESYRSAIWDPSGTTQGSVTVRSLTYDVFCSGTAALPDGRALIVGGTSDYSFTGENRASIFDPNPLKTQ